jgi:hypothetical protein
MGNAYGRQFGLRSDVLLFLIFSAVRCLWLYVTYSVGNDQCTQMNVALNILEGRGIVYGSITQDGSVFTPYNWFPPGVSFLMVPILWLTGNPFVAEFVIKCLISILEGALVVSIVRRFVVSEVGRAVLVAVLALYTGHLDRGGVTDMYTAVGGVWLMWIAYRRIESGVRFDTSTQAALAFVLPSMVMMKYNALPIVMVPLGMFLWLAIFSRQRYLDMREWVSLSFASLLSLACFVWSIKFIGAGNARAAESVQNLGSGQLASLFAERGSHLLRIDPFWLHFGKRVDMYFKFIYTRFLAGPSASLIEAFRFWQLTSLVIFAVLVYALYRKASFQKNMLRVLFFFTLAHVSFLSLLTIVKGPELNARYGVDSIFWTFMEESRLFAHLTFAFALALLLAAWRYSRPIFWGLAILFSFNTVRSMADTKSEMGYLTDAFHRMQQTPPPDITAEVRDNRRAYYVWNYLLGHTSTSNPPRP